MFALPYIEDVVLIFLSMYLSVFFSSISVVATIGFDIWRFLKFKVFMTDVDSTSLSNRILLCRVVFVFSWMMVV